MSTRTARQLAVLQAAAAIHPPYADQVRRRSRLTDAEFEETVRDLVEADAPRRRSAPLGELLYPTGWAGP